MGGWGTQPVERNIHLKFSEMFLLHNPGSEGEVLGLGVQAGVDRHSLLAAILEIRWWIRQEQEQEQTCSGGVDGTSSGVGSVFSCARW